MQHKILPRQLSLGEVKMDYMKKCHQNLTGSSAQNMAPLLYRYVC